MTLPTTYFRAAALSEEGVQLDLSVADPSTGTCVPLTPDRDLLERRIAMYRLHHPRRVVTVHVLLAMPMMPLPE